MPHWFSQTNNKQTTKGVSISPSKSLLTLRTPFPPPHPTQKQNVFVRPVWIDLPWTRLLLPSNGGLHLGKKRLQTAKLNDSNYDTRPVTKKKRPPQPQQQQQQTAVEVGWDFHRHSIQAVLKNAVLQTWPIWNSNCTQHEVCQICIALKVVSIWIPKKMLCY